MADRISSLDSGYISGDLSLFPEILDDSEILYKATNHSKTKLKQPIGFNSEIVIVEDTTGFPSNGIIRIGPDIGVAGQFEMIYYGKKTKNTYFYISNENQDLESLLEKAQFESKKKQCGNIEFYKISYFRWCRINKIYLLDKK